MAIAPAVHRRRAKRPDRTRGTATQRGYDRQWTKLRKVIFERDLGLCQDPEGCDNFGEEVDHIVPFKGLADPKRLEPSNLRLLCRHHHAKKTNAIDYHGRTVR
jgi:5-methylcytosine-specific restriction protein A